MEVEKLWCYVNVPRVGEIVGGDEMWEMKETLFFFNISSHFLYSYVPSELALSFWMNFNEV